VTVTDCPSVYDTVRSESELEGFVNSAANTEGIDIAARVAVSAREMRATRVNIFTMAQIKST
jgi:hypothetical protein